MQLRGLSSSTQEGYVNAVCRLAENDHRSPDLISEENLRQYFLYLTYGKKAARASATVALCGIKFLSEHTLLRQWPTLRFVRPPRQSRLPVVLSREEVRLALVTLPQPTLEMLRAYSPDAPLTAVDVSCSDSTRDFKERPAEQVSGTAFAFCLISIWRCGLVDLQLQFCLCRNTEKTVSDSEYQMKNNSMRLPVFLCIVALAGFIGAGTLRADTLSVGGNFQGFSWTLDGSTLTNTGGSIDQSYLDNRALPFLYCIDITTEIYVPGDYNQTYVTNNGTIHGNPVNNAGQVAWLVNTYGFAAGQSTNGAGGFNPKVAALQAAIWSVIYDGEDGRSHFVLTDTRFVTQYDSIMASLGSNTDPLGSVLWITPKDAGVEYQGLVSVPEPNLIILLGLGLLMVCGLALFRTN